jgi:membrane protein DedA with SNARE-associated domain
MDGILDLIRSVPDSPSGLLDFVTGLLLAHGYLVIFIGAALDNFGLPASGDIVLFAGGFFANDGRAALPLVVLAAMSGALVSDNAVYWIGRRGGRPLLHRILKTRLLSFLLDAKSLGRVERYFDEHGGKTVFVGRFGPGLRSMTPLFAGVSHMKYRRFLPYNLASVAVWASVYGAIGYVLRRVLGRSPRRRPLVRLRLRRPRRTLPRLLRLPPPRPARREGKTGHAE